MFFFNRTAVLEIDGVGQVKYSEEEGFIPYVKAKPAHNEKLIRSFF